MSSRLMKMGTSRVIGATSPSRDFIAVFEDDGSTGYFYALNADPGDRKILDVMSIYVLEQTFESAEPCKFQILWSPDGWRVMLKIDDYAHAIFDFLGKQGYCRMNYPNLPRQPGDEWHSETHEWTDEALRWFAD